MSKIEKPLARATVAENCNLTLNMGTALQESLVEDEYLNQLADNLVTKGKEMETSIAQDLSRAKTEELVAADDDRDSLITSLKLFLRAHMKWKREHLSKKASDIYKIIKTHGLAMADESYEEESSLLDSLLAELAKRENSAILKELNLNALIVDLAAAEVYFKKLYLEAANIEAAKEAFIAATTYKKELLEEQRKVVDHLNAMRSADPRKYTTVSNKIAELMKILNQKIKNRLARLQKGQDDV